MTQETNHDHPGDEDVQMPLGAGGESAPAEEYVENKPRVNNSTVALIGAFAAALVVLYLLGLQNKPRSASAEEKQHEQELTTRIDAMLGNRNDREKIGDFFDATTRLVTKLQDYFNNKSAGTEMGSNPFERDVPRAPVLGEVSPATPIVNGNAAHAALMLNVAKEFDSLKLDGVMLGSTPTALINKRMMKVGEKFTYLTVTDIKEGAVLLSFEDKVFRLEAGSMNKSPK